MPNPEKNSGKAAGNEENEFEKMAKEVPSFEENAAAYEASHPEAVKDVDKARVMAEAGDYYRTRAAKERANAIEAVKNNESGYESTISRDNDDEIHPDEYGLPEDYGPHKEPIEDAKENIQALTDAAKADEDYAEERYDSKEDRVEELKDID